MPSVLIVDDDAPTRTMVRALLTRNGYDVTLADGGSEAIALLGRKKYDAVVLDLSMPEVNGHEVIAYLNAQLPDAKCILLISAGKTVDIAREGDNPSVSATLRKPFEITDLVQRVADCVGHPITDLRMMPLGEHE